MMDAVPRGEGCPVLVLMTVQIAVDTPFVVLLLPDALLAFGGIIVILPQTVPTEIFVTYFIMGDAALPV